MKVVIEIPKGSTNKYELKDGVLTLDREVSIPYPYNYGYIPDTLAGDGDPLDVFVVGPEVVPGTQMEVEIVGVIKMLDGEDSDDKVICTFGNQVVNYTSIEKFLINYKKTTKILGTENKKIALKIVEESLHNFNNGKILE